MDPSRIDGSRALVCGATGAIGAATARLLAARGASVLLLGSGESELARIAAAIRQEGGRTDTYTADPADPTAVRSTLRTLVATHGCPDVLVNVIVIATPLRLLEASALETAQRIAMSYLAAANPTCELFGRLAARSGHVVTAVSLPARLFDAVAARQHPARGALASFAGQLRAETVGSGLTTTFATFRTLDDRGARAAAAAIVRAIERRAPTATTRDPADSPRSSSAEAFVPVTTAL